MHEATSWWRNSFLTLTYDDEHLPEGGDLVVGDWQKFVKRLRKRGEKFKYLHVGEYGDLNRRPHFHACMFGVDWRDEQSILLRQGKYPLWTHPELEEVWGQGHVAVGHLTFESAAYVARYCMKKRSTPHDEVSTQMYDAAYERVDPDTGECWHVRREYTTRSNGIGKEWFEKYHDDVYPDDEVIQAGKRFKPPRYYDKQLDPAFLEGIKKRRQERAAEHAANNTWERLRVRERIAENRAKLHEHRKV